MDSEKLLRAILPDVLIDNFDVDRFEKTDMCSPCLFHTSGQKKSCPLKYNFILPSILFI